MSSTTIDKSGERVQRMFGEIAPHYDRMNHLLSLNVDRYWRRWTVKKLQPQPGEPILDVCRQCGVRFALEVHPGQIAFDLHTAEMALEALGGREEFGFTFDPSHLHWQGVDPVEFLRRFPDRILHVHVKDIALALNGRNGILGSYLPYGDLRRGWDFRSPGRGGLDWEGIIRALNDIGYDGPLSVDWSDAGMDRDYGAEDAYKFVKRLDFEPSPRQRLSEAFREA